MDEDVVSHTGDWTKTREAVANFRRLLLCSKCSTLMKEPVCLGTCEHMLCRSCAGPRAGDGCAVCQSPAWVKDIQINRQLSNITQLFCSLESLLSPAENSDSSLAERQTEPESPLLKHKKNFKIWFSPRSRKVRCMVDKPSEVTAPGSKTCGETVSAQPDPNTAQSKDLSIFNFQFSSQDSDSTCLQRRKADNKNKKKTSKNAANRKPAVHGGRPATRRQTKQKVKEKKLEAINQQWGISKEDKVHQDEEPACAEGTRRSSKRVSFLSPADTTEEPQSERPEGSDGVASPTRSILKRSSSGGGITGPEDAAQPDQNMSASPLQRNSLSADDPKASEDTEKQDELSLCKQSPKRLRMEKKSTSETTPKRPRASLVRRAQSLGQMDPTLGEPPYSVTPKRGKSTRSPRAAQRGSPSCSPSVGRKSPRSPGASVGRPASGSPTFMKRNHRGETPLHLAAIKGDVEAAKALLDEGADPNLKDNAGWTPLHEACNLGHLAVVEVLVLRGALLNTPGYENDSPLHDAVMNGHVAVAKLLLQHGASQHVLNQFGKRPADYAVSPEMQEIFQEASEGPHPASAPVSPSASLSMVSDGVRSDEQVVFLASKLSESQQQQLAKLGRLLGAKMSEGFSGSGVEACLQARKWIPETEHEAGEGPRRSRINKCSLLPPLLDGCFFFLMGSFKSPPKEGLVELLREGGGQILSRQPKPDSDVTQTLSAAAYHAPPGSDQALCTQYILYDPQGPHKPAVVRRGKVWSAPSTWLIDCIAAFRLLPVPEYQP
ncbi:BRCA1-associated RING domain protein 1 isoform X2 [Myripristis murdjan]|uniref:BRCA1 associated RING domain 1 n=1 Tax=Myripristis murdjan TaxID=586833 RepID=A0A667ZWH4_9TELE|nr:BRCA1-associated RING domain protein 1 isoform X2 [Myripristis murdjan]